MVYDQVLDGIQTRIQILYQHNLPCLNVCVALAGFYSCLFIRTLFILYYALRQMNIIAIAIPNLN